MSHDCFCFCNRLWKFRNSQSSSDNSLVPYEPCVDQRKSIEAVVSENSSDVKRNKDAEVEIFTAVSEKKNEAYDELLKEVDDEIQIENETDLTKFMEKINKITNILKYNSFGKIKYKKENKL